MNTSNHALLRETIRLSLLEKREVAAVDAAVDGVEDQVAAVLDGIVGELEAAALEQETERVDEVGVAFVAGAALAMPIIMKGIVKVAQIFRGALAQAGLADGSPGWETWMSEKADELHHLYIHICEKIVDGAVKVAETASLGKYKGPSDANRKKAANVLFMAVLATLAASAGVGIASALAGKSYAVAGTETLLGAIKISEIQVIASELLVDILGFGVAELATAAGAAAASVGLS